MLSITDKWKIICLPPLSQIDSTWLSLYTVTLQRGVSIQCHVCNYVKPDGLPCRSNGSKRPHLLFVGLQCSVSIRLIILITLVITSHESLVCQKYLHAKMYPLPKYFPDTLENQAAVTKPADKICQSVRVGGGRRRVNFFFEKRLLIARQREKSRHSIKIKGKL